MPIGLKTDPNVIDVVNKWGENIDIDTIDTNQIVWPVKKSVQDYIFIDEAIQLYVKSTSTNDTLLGSGAQTVAVLYQTLNEEKTVTIDMNGTGNQPLPELSFGVFRFSVETTGATNKNEGQLQIVDGSGNIYAVIEIGEGQTQISVYRIPELLKGRVKGHKADYARTGAANDAVMRLRVRKKDGTIISKWDPTLTTANIEDVKIYGKDGGIDLDPGDWIYWEVLSVSANNTPIRGAIDIELTRV